MNTCGNFAHFCTSHNKVVLSRAFFFYLEIYVVVIGVIRCKGAGITADKPKFKVISVVGNSCFSIHK